MREHTDPSDGISSTIMHTQIQKELCEVDSDLYLFQKLVVSIRHMNWNFSGYDFIDHSEIPYPD